MYIFIPGSIPYTYIAMHSSRRHIYIYVYVCVCVYTLYIYIYIYRRHGNPLQCSCLENPMDREAWWSTVHGVAKSQT